MAIIGTDWLGRSTGPGVLLATDFSRAEDFTRDGPEPRLYANNMSQAQFNMLKQVNDNGIPCLHIDVVANNTGGTTQGQAWRSRFRSLAYWPNDGDGIGTQPFWIQFGFKISASRLIPWSVVDEYGNPWIDGISTGNKVEYNSWKFAIIANMSASNPWGMGDQSSNSISHVLTNKSHRGHQFPVTYSHDNVYTNGRPFEPPTPDGQDFNLSYGWQNKNGGLCLYSNSGNCPIWPVDTWIWFQYRQHTRTYGGTAGNELDISWALPGDTSWTPLVVRREYLVGNQPVPWRNGFNAIWLTPFETNRSIVAGVDSNMRYRHLIVSTQEIPFPAADNPINVGQGQGEVTVANITLVVDQNDTVTSMKKVDFDLLASKAAERDALAAQVATLTTDKEALTAANATLTSDKATLTSANATLTATNTSQTQKIAALNTWIDAAIADAQAASTRDRATNEGDSILNRPRP